MSLNKLKTSFITNVPWCLGIGSNITTKPKSITLPGNKNLVLFRDSNSDVRAIDDICPHRGARLSQGKLKNGCVECPYHGWVYNGDGILSLVPSNKNKSIPINADIKSYNIKEYNNFVWMLPTIDSVFPYCNELTNPKWNCVTGESILTGNWVDWIANGLDISHINFVHDFADENNGEITDFKVMENKKTIKCRAEVRPKAVSIMTEPMQVKRCPIQTEFFYPNTNVVKIKLKEPYEFITYTTITPISQDKTLMSWCFAYNIQLGDPFAMKFLEKKFHNEMLKTISEDEAIIQNLGPFNFDVNVQCDMYQIQGLRKIERHIEKYKEYVMQI